MTMMAWLILASIITLAWLLWSNFSRTDQAQLDQLIPNCLLTKYPIVFVTGYRSLFYFRNYWNQVPSYLCEHGYDVKVLNLPWRNSGQRLKVFADELIKLEAPVHLIGDQSIEIEIKSIAEMDLPNIASVTIVSEKHPPESIKTEDLDCTRIRANQSSKINELVLDAQPMKLKTQNLLLKANNIFNSGRAPISPSSVGLFSQSNHKTLEPFLKHAIHLAEDDLALR